MINFEEEKVLSLEQTKELVLGTALEKATDEELLKVIECVKQFCEINFEIYLLHSQKHLTEETENDHIRIAA